jgi:hypothetical protein
MPLLFGRAIEFLCRRLNHLRLRRAVRDISFMSPFGRHKVDVHIGAMFTCISVDGQDHFFRRT